MFVKHELEKFVEIIETESDYIMWIKLHNTILSCEKDLIFGVIYVPPMQSRFFTLDEFEIAENEISAMNSCYENVLLVGDMNAQTANLVDYTENDDFLDKYFDLDRDTLEFFDQKNAMLKEGIPLSRNSQDKKKNNHGYKLIEICKNNNLLIVNGRFGPSFSTGQMTFRNISVIDYLIVSIPTYTLINNFQILKTDQLLSDGHAVVDFSIKRCSPKETNTSK